MLRTITQEALKCSPHLNQLSYVDENWTKILTSILKYGSIWLRSKIHFKSVWNDWKYNMKYKKKLLIHLQCDLNHHFMVLRCDSVWSKFPEILRKLTEKLCFPIPFTDHNFHNFLKLGSFLKITSLNDKVGSNLQPLRISWNLGSNYKLNLKMWSFSSVDIKSVRVNVQVSLRATVVRVFAFQSVEHYMKMMVQVFLVPGNYINFSHLKHLSLSWILSSFTCMLLNKSFWTVALRTQI